jgi:hypothetical protein
MNPCNLEAGGELEFETTTPETVFRQHVTTEAQIDRPTVPPEGHTLDSTQEFGGPDESRYPLDNGPRGEGSTLSLDSASGTSQY